MNDSDIVREVKRLLTHNCSKFFISGNNFLIVTKINVLHDGMYRLVFFSLHEVKMSVEYGNEVDGIIRRGSYQLVWDGMS